MFFCFFWLCGPFGSFVLRWGGSVTDHQYFLLLNQTYVLSNVRPELFVYSCPCFSLCVIFIFYNRHSYFYLLYLIFKRIFHLGGLVSRMHTSDYISFTEWECFCFSLFTEYNFWVYEYSMHTLNILSLNVNGLNSAVKRTRVLEYLHRKSISCALIQETHLICGTGLHHLLVGYLFVTLHHQGLFFICFGSVLLSLIYGHMWAWFVLLAASWLLCWPSFVSSWWWFWSLCKLNTKENVVCWFCGCEEDNNTELVYATHVWENIVDP